MYDHVTSINSVTATVNEDTVKNVLLTDVRYYLLMSASKPFFTVTQCCCPRGKSKVLVFVVSEMTYNVSMGTLNPTILYYYLSLSSRTNLQVFVLGPQVLVLVLEPYHSSIAHIKQTMWYHFMRLIPN